MSVRFRRKGKCTVDSVLLLKADRLCDPTHCHVKKGDKVYVSDNLEDLGDMLLNKDTKSVKVLDDVLPVGGERYRIRYGTLFQYYRFAYKL